jgi:hypothetical protein
MSRKPSAISYDHLSIGPVAEKEPVAPQRSTDARDPTPATKKTMRDDAAPVTLYLHPDARKALKRYALEQDLKVHDLLLEAVEEWFRSHGLRERVRVQPADGR